MKRVVSILITAALLLASLAGCGSIRSLMTPSAPSIAPSADGYIHVIMPESLMGGQDAQDWIDSGNANSAATPDTQSADMLQWCTKAVANADGTATLFCTQKQYDGWKNEMLELARGGGLSDDSDIKSVHADRALENITIYVDSKNFGAGLLGFADDMIVFMPVYAGMYQVLCGAGDAWHVTVTVKDYKTHKVVSKTDYPTSDMSDSSE